MTSTMEVGSSAAAERRFVHLKGVSVSFTARRPNYASFIRVQVEEQTYESQVFGKDLPVVWNRDIYVSSASSVSISCHKKQTVTKKVFKRMPYATVTIDLKSARIEDGSTRSFADDRQRVLVGLEFGQSIERVEAFKLLGEGVSSALASKVILLEKIGKISDFIGVVIEVGAAFAELNDVAKVVFGVADVVFKKLQRQRECHEAAVSLAEFVLDKLPITEMIPEKMQNALIRNTLQKMLKITEEALNILQSYANGSTFERDLGKIRDLKAKLTDVSADLSLSLTSQNYVAVQEINERAQSIQRLAQDNEERQEIEMLRMLGPVIAARHSEGHGCLEDTRIELLGDLRDRLEERGSSSKLIWLHGFAGAGKSSIAATVCRNLKEKGVLAGSFFCKRDIPEQREPGRVLPSLSYSLGLIYRPYRDCIIRALEKDLDIGTGLVDYQLTTLFLKPLAELASQKHSLGQPLVFVIDALDECGTDHTSRTQIAHCLSRIAALADWLKIFVTSRPFPELEQMFSPSQLHHCIDLNDQDSEGDIMKYTRSCLERVTRLDLKWLEDDVIKALSQKASGLFIWTSTVAEFIRGQYDKNSAMEKILAGQDADPTRSNLDHLYLTVISGSRGSNAENRAIMKAVLGIIHITAKNRPLSIDGLCDLMPNEGGSTFSKAVLEEVLDDLRSVLYEDSSKGNVIRVCHPSFLDFLGSGKRCGDYWTNADELDKIMIKKCLALMETMLRFNICGLESSEVANKDVPNLEQKIRERIPESLQYACLYFFTHLTEANRSTVDGLIEDFFGSMQVLHWLEVLSLIGGLRTGLDTLQAIRRIYQNEIARDTHKLLSSSYDAISLSTPHLYISALTWLPEKSELKRQFYGRFSNQPLISSGRNKSWHPALWMNMMGDMVVQVAFSPDSRHVASCSNDGTIRVWETKTGLLAMKLLGHTDGVYAISYSPDGKQLVSGSSDDSVRVWDISAGTAVGAPLVGHVNIVDSVCFSPDGMCIASRSLDRTVKIWDSSSGSEVRTMDGLSEQGGIVYSPDGGRLACCGLEGIIVRVAQSGDLMGELQIGRVWCLTYSPDGRFLASGGDDRIVRLLDGNTLAELAVLKGHLLNVYSVAFSPDSSQLLSASDDSTMITWDVASKEMVGSPLRAHGAKIVSAAYSPDGLYIASASSDKSVRVWDARSISSGKELPVTICINSISLSPSGEEFASAEDDGNIRVRDVHTGAVLRTLTGHARAVAYSPSGKVLASGSRDRTVRLWDTATGDELQTYEGHTASISSIVFVANGKHVISASFDGAVRRWQTGPSSDHGELLIKHGSAVWSVCISPNGELLASGGNDEIIRFFDLHNGSVVEQQCASSWDVYCLAFSPAGTYVASGSRDGKIQIWDLETYLEVRRLEGHTNSVISLAFSFDGNLVLSASADATVKLWDSRTGAELCTLNGHTDMVRGAGFTNDERRILSASADGTCRIWSSSCQQIGPSCVPDAYREALSRPLSDGWIKLSTGELILWIPSEYRDGIRDMSEVCVPADAPGHPVRLDWSKLVKGEEWTSILKAK